MKTHYEVYQIKRRFLNFFLNDLMKYYQKNLPKLRPLQQSQIK